jgi:hypothetical protein
MRIGGYNGRAYWGYRPHAARSIDCARKRTTVQVDSADKRIRINLIKEIIEQRSSLLLMMRTLVWRHGLIRDLFSNPLAMLHLFEPIEEQIASKTQKLETKQIVFPSATMARIYSPEDAKIGFGKVMESESVMETDQHSEDSGSGSHEVRKRNRFKFVACHNYKYREIVTKGLH